MALQRTQVLIVGGGMVGLALAIGLAKAGRKVTVVERSETPGEMPEQTSLRVSAINAGVAQWLSELGAWQRLPTDRCAPYHGMSVWEHDSFGKIEFTAEQADLASLGTILENQVLVAALWQQAEEVGVQLIAGVDIETPEYHESDVSVALINGKGNGNGNGDVILAQLLVAADGARSQLRDHVGTPIIHRDYEQQGLVATIESEEPHAGIARQVFHAGGPLALLPMADAKQSSIVWSLPTLEAQAMCALSAEEFSQKLTVASNNCMGMLRPVSERVSFPLRMQYAQTWVHGRQVLVGDAAHTIHPLAGQGANLGFGDAFHLVQQLTSLGTLNGQWDNTELNRALRRYERARKAAAVRHIATMEGFHQLFTGSNPIVKMGRSLGLSLVNQTNPVKDFFLRQASELG
ncbi:FAD-dependent 2-octaprenylphenol hydroxylase [Aliidiomarina iranensis]|uniref:FAD-dependent 2-octaprenylphenol hydroxylase n=1 Tax=Aliidiomarina iranensis TaxID=1434071 RepID=A0A432VVA0_9GAMM|nr:FAD-dependent oxidoreductase [Aliidiomarina iranensis]RUO20466.1 FAD-dependent 2-octaprenylphenol hydroxylase [Aliidiomarina iranensis]